MKKIWRKNWEIKRASFLLAHEAVEGFSKMQNHYFGKKVLHEAIWVNKNSDNIATYFLKHELRQAIELTLNLILNQPKKILAIHQKTIIYNKQFFAFMTRVRKMNLVRLSNKQLVSLYLKVYQLLQLSHGYSFYSTYLVDADGEDLTNYLLNYTREKIEKQKLKLNFAQVFSLLTTPTKESFAQKEALASLFLVKKIKANPLAFKFFLQTKVPQIKARFSSLDRPLKNKILAHCERWRWTPYTYLGPAYELDYYLETWQGILKQKIDIDREIRLLQTFNKTTKQEKTKMFSQLKIGASDRKIFALASEIVWLKAFRKDVLFFSCFVVDKIYQEIGRRLNLSLNQARHLIYLEVSPALLKGKVPLAEINQRIKGSVIHFQGDKFRVLTGQKANRFLNQQNFEKIVIKDVKEIKGTTACPGQVKGRVQIINLPEEMIKMKKGDIMVAHSTYPALVPAMKKAGAIITEDGGLTCHAAIVARELKVPCVVGASIATKVLKDGDLVEVDATLGLVKKI